MGKEKYYLVTASRLNVRSGPGIEYDIIAKLEKDDEIVSPVTEGWVPVLFEDNTTGWVFEKYLKEAPEEAEPVTPQPPPDVVSGISYPIFQRDLTRIFGTPFHGQFRRKNLVTIDLSEFGDAFSHVRTWNGQPFTAVEGHRILAGPLTKALRLVCERNLAGELKTYDGCFAIRKMKGGDRYSVHSWGLAVDFNAATSPFQTRHSPTWPNMVTDFSDDFVRCFAAAGFEWGGLWTSIYDPMHFQLPWIRDWRELANPLGPKVYQAEEPSPIINGEYDFSSREGVIAAIKAECQKQGLSLPAQIAYVLATTEWETAHTFQPVREAFWKDEDWRRRHLSRYYPYYGRGYVQLTWEANYRKYAKILGIDLVGEPDLALEPRTALYILVHGFKTGAFTGKKLSDYINEGKTDFYNARRCINRLDRADEIAALAEKFLET